MKKKSASRGRNPRALKVTLVTADNEKDDASPDACNVPTEPTWNVVRMTNIRTCAEAINHAHCGLTDKKKKKTEGHRGGLTVNERAVLKYLLMECVHVGPITKVRHKKHGPWCVWPMINTIALCTGMNRVTASRTIASLVERGLLSQDVMLTFGHTGAERHRHQWTVNEAAILALERRPKTKDDGADEEEGPFPDEEARQEFLNVAYGYTVPP